MGDQGDVWMEARASRKDEVTHQQVGQRFDAWYHELQVLAQTGTKSSDEQECLAHCLQVLAHLRPQRILCYDLDRFPRTNNDLEGYICAIKTRYRRRSFRKNWNAYLLRYGSRVAYYEWWTQETERTRKLDSRLRQVKRDSWRQTRRETCCGPSDQLKRFRFRHHPAKFLASLQTRWAQATGT